MPFANAFQGWHLLIILLVIILIFGAPKLPGLAKSLGQSMKIFRNEVKDLRSDDKKPTTGGTDLSTDRSTTSADGSTDGQSPRTSGSGSTPTS
ncbi:twin-arginine translocase TatA/TatE family subunit [Desertivibrio insolitus]|uniref:twin-arginine translocase TatA/TatE family subunit n=1 Tax=Herbiconiux sp. SYSU D00978 TaxID=2812562 RepID=UPI001A9715DF|nr:twin-arginine translocase TatA/TatE family subunit [Herbiconiux sp. SYSU D00978]